MTDSLRLPEQAHPTTTFADYAAAGFAEDLLPILPHDAAINPESPAHDNLVENRGKVPGKKRRGGWMGFGDWTESYATPDDLLIWQGWRAGIGMQGRRFPALDIDVDDPELADAIHKEATSTLGVAPARFGRGSRRILVYAGAGFAKRRVVFRRANAPAAEIAEGGAAAEKPQAVEFLAKCQQYVVEGIHPKTGQPYEWRGDGGSLVECGAAGLTPITAAQLDTFDDRLELLLELFGYEVIKRSVGGYTGDGDVYQEGLLAPSLGAVERALAALPNEADYDEWINVMVATKAATGGSGEGFELFADWSASSGLDVPETTLFKYESFHAPYRIGWDWLARHATENGDGSFHSAHEDFEALEEPPAPGEEPKGPLVTSKVQAMFDRYVWVERLERACDLVTGELLTRTQFNVRNAHIGPPTSSKDSAWAVLISNPKRLQTVKAVTYRPGSGLFVSENLPGLVGPCVNQWRDPCPDLPATVSDADVRFWLDHVAFVIPDARERGIVLDWLAWVIQNPGEKPNWAIVIGSTYEGMGKDMLLEPVREALGAANVREVGPGDLMSQWTWWAANTRLVIVEEMHSFERKETMNRLKPLIAAPPYTLTVNRKGEPQYEVPNIIASVFFTNMDNALAVSKQDRRFFITWNDGEPRTAEYYRSLDAWYRGGGRELAARWLQLRDVSAFEPKGRAPDTAAKGAMRLAALPDLEATIHDGLLNREGPFARRLVTVGEVAEWVRDFIGPFRPPSPRRLVGALKAAGAIQFDRRPSLGSVPAECRRPHAYDPKQVQLFAMPGDGVALELLDDLPALREGFWAERLSVHEEFAADAMVGGVQ
jgi:hypothetical protein